MPTKDEGMGTTKKLLQSVLCRLCLYAVESVASGWHGDGTMAHWYWMALV